MRDNAGQDDESLSGSPLVGAARDWSEGRTAKDMCNELFVRVLQLSIVCKQLCWLLGTSMEDAMHAGAEQSLKEMGVDPTTATSAAESLAGGSHASAPGNSAQPNL